jgi:hypothetical protein
VNSQFLISGMFRSGTTMLARMLHANPNIVCASDPFAPIFKSFRNSVSEDLLDTFDPNAPLHDYYLDRKQNALFQEMQERDFSQKILPREVVALQGQIKKHCLPYSPLIVPYLNELDGASYEQLFESAIKIILKVYGNEKEQTIGFKEVWVNEFTPHFQKLKAGNRIIHLIRDPRSVVASNFASGSTYPLLFLVRQWRKIATLAWNYAQGSSDVKLIRFEDLLSKPEAVARELCEFLSVDFHKNMTEPSSYIDGAGKSWRQNTSFRMNSERDGERAFNCTALDKWKQVLKDEVLALIDLFCSKEMALLGYEPVSNLAEVGLRFDILYYEDDLSNFAGWIKPYASYNNYKELSAELLRLELIESQRQLSEQFKRMLVLEPSMYEVFCQQTSNP